MSSSSEMEVCSVASDESMDEHSLNSEFNFVEFYANNFNTGKYSYSIKTSTWYYYNDLNLLLESKTKNPMFLKVEICRNFDRYFRDNPPEELEKKDFDKLLKMVWIICIF